MNREAIQKYSSNLICSHKQQSIYCSADAESTEDRAEQKWSQKVFTVVASRESDKFGRDPEQALSSFSSLELKAWGSHFQSFFCLKASRRLSSNSGSLASGCREHSWGQRSSNPGCSLEILRWHYKLLRPWFPQIYLFSYSTQFDLPFLKNFNNCHGDSNVSWR